MDHDLKEVQRLAFFSELSKIANGSLLDQWLSSPMTPETQELDHNIGTLLQQMQQVPQVKGSILPWRSKEKVEADKKMVALHKQMRPLLHQRAALSGWEPSEREKRLIRDEAFFGKVADAVSPSPVKTPMTWGRAAKHGLPELIPGITAGLGGMIAAKYDKPVSAGAAIGGAVGAIPFLLKGID